MTLCRTECICVSHSYFHSHNFYLNNIIFILHDDFPFLRHFSFLCFYYISLSHSQSYTAKRMLASFTISHVHCLKIATISFYFLDYFFIYIYLSFFTAPQQMWHLKSLPICFFLKLLLHSEKCFPIRSIFTQFNKSSKNM